MKQSKLIQLIEELTPKDRERFSLFVRSPYFNQHQKTAQLLDIILEELDRPNGNLGKEDVYRVLFTSNRFDEQKLYNVMSYLKKLYHRFLAIQHIEKKTFLESVYTLEAALEQNQFDLLKNRAKQLEKSLHQYPYEDIEYYYTNYRLNALMTNYHTQYVDRTNTTYPQKMFNFLDDYYIAEKLKTCCHFTANMMRINIKYDFPLLDEILEYVQKNWEDYKQKTGIAIYYVSLMSLREANNPEHYVYLKELLNNPIDAIAPDEARDLFSFASNYCIRQINSGDSAYRKELFELYQQSLRKKIILNNGILGEWDYKNITTLACSLQEYEWTESFLEDYKDRLQADRRDNAYNYNLANFHFFKKNFDEVKYILQMVQFNDLSYQLSASSLLLRTYYSLGEIEPLFAHIEAFRIYIMRNKKMTTVEKRGYTNFLRFAKKLASLKNQMGTVSKRLLKEKFESLNNRIQSTENVSMRSWLIAESQV